MAVPRNRHSNARKNTRRAHDAKRPANILTCKNCKSAVLAHRMCASCGHYNGRSVAQSDQAPAQEQAQG
ncbi:MAG: 50S ribosomal protein L32 [Simkaniaceae bacterium]|nr:50S ribosomal protein L32 [Simkaniaceae bacterium]